MADYKLVEKPDFEVQDDDIVFEKSNFTYEFTKSSLIESILHIRKIKRQMESQISLNSAEMENIAHFHPFVKDMSEEDLQVAFLYERSLATKKEAAKKLEEAIKAEEEEMATIAKIEEQLGIKVEIPETQGLNIEVK